MMVSIVIPNYNGLKYLGVCLESLLKQDFRGFEVIVVDNGSSDGSCEFLKESYPWVKQISLPQNFGFSRAVNGGIKVSCGEYVVLLNNDTEAEACWLSNLVNCIENDKNIFSCSSKMISYSERDKIDDAGDFYTVLGWTIKRGLNKSMDKYDKIDSIFSSCAGAAIYRKKILDEIGCFDESFFAYFEDVDIGYRAKIFGYKNIYCSNAVIYHIGSATSGSRHNSFKVRLASRNSVYLAYKNMPLLQLIVNLPFLFLGFLVKGLYFSIKGFGREYVQGLIEGLGSLKNVSKIPYSSKSIFNYAKIEKEIIINAFKYIIS